MLGRVNIVGHVKTIPFKWIERINIDHSVFSWNKLKESEEEKLSRSQIFLLNLSKIMWIHLPTSYVRGLTMSLNLPCFQLPLKSLYVTPLHKKS